MAATSEILPNRLIRVVINRGHDPLILIHSCHTVTFTLRVRHMRHNAWSIRMQQGILATIRHVLRQDCLALDNLR